MLAHERVPLQLREGRERAHAQLLAVEADGLQLVEARQVDEDVGLFSRRAESTHQVGAAGQQARARRGLRQRRHELVHGGG